MEIRANYATLTLPELDTTVGVAPDSHSAYMRLHFAMAEARLHMWHTGGYAVEAMTAQAMSSMWRGDLVHEWDDRMLQAKRAKYPEAL